MIETVSELLEEFRKISLEKIKQDDSDIKHPVAIGDNYEGLTSELLSRAIFKGLNLKLVQRSFIYNNQGEISDEMDCLLVTGEGVKMSFTDRYKFHFRDVIAVIQVKKNLYGKDIYDAHSNLKSVLDVSEPQDFDEETFRIFRHAYRALVKKDLPTTERKNQFTFQEEVIYSYLMLEAFNPVRIVIGYDGYSSEFNFREGLYSMLERRLEKRSKFSFSPFSIPNLFICGNYSIVKNNGMPMGAPLMFDRDYYFPLLFSSSGKAMNHLLEVIWTRLSYKFKISSSIFGDDNSAEEVHTYIWCKDSVINGEHGWEYYYPSISHSELTKKLTSKPYKPAEISEHEYAVLGVLCNKGPINVDEDKEFNDYLHSNNLNKNVFLERIVSSGLAYIDKRTLDVLVDNIDYCFYKGKVYAGENRNGELTQFIDRLQRDENIE